MAVRLQGDVSATIKNGYRRTSASLKISKWLQNGKKRRESHIEICFHWNNRAHNQATGPQPKLNYVV